MYQKHTNMSSLNVDYVKNPKTNRPVKIGSRIWRELVKEGLIASQNLEDDKELYELKPSDDALEIIGDLDKELPHNVQAVRGRGKYAGKIVKRDKPHDNLEKTVSTVSKMASQVIKQMPEVTSDNEEDWESALEQLIMSEMVKPKNTPKLKLSEVKRGGVIYKKTIKKAEEPQEDFEEVEPPQESDSSSKDESSDY